MNETSQVNSTRGCTGSSVATGFVLGALVGAGIALLLAPASGKETRQRLANTGRRWGNTARSKFDLVRDIGNDLKQDATSAWEAGREAFEHGRKSSESRPVSELKS